MNHKKALLSLTMLSALALAGCGEEAAPADEQAEATSSNLNETGLPIVEEEITLHIAGPYDDRTGTDYNNLETIKEINEGTNMNIEWELSPGSDWADKRSLMIASVASGDLPDVILKVTNEQVVQGGNQGYFIPLNDLFEQYAPNLNTFLNDNPAVKEAITAPDGNIYSVPYADMSEYKHVEGNTLWINQVWLDELGIEMPETLEEFNKALTAFRDNDMNGNGDPNDEIPLTGLFGTGEHSLSFLYGSFNTLNEDFIVRDGVVEYTKTTDEYRDVIEYITSLYQEGLVDQEIFTMAGADVISKISSGDEANVGAFFAWSSDRITNEAFKDDYLSPVLALEGPEGHRIRGKQNLQISPGAFVITSENENPEATLRWVDQAFDYEMSFFLRQGPNRVELNDEDIYEIVPEDEGFTAGEWRVKETPYNNFVYGFTQEMREQMDLSNLKPGLLDPDKDEWYEISKPYLKEWVWPRMLYTPEQNQQIARYQTDINTYVDQMAASWIIGESDIDSDWDTYISTLEQMGLEDYTGIYEEAYETYDANN